MGQQLQERRAEQERKTRLVLKIDPPAIIYPLFLVLFVLDLTHLLYPNICFFPFHDWGYDSNEMVILSLFR